MNLVNHTLETLSAICWLWGQFSLLRGTCLIYIDISPVLNARNYLNMTNMRSWSAQLKEAKDNKGCLTGQMRIEQRLSEIAASLVCWVFFVHCLLSSSLTSQQICGSTVMKFKTFVFWYSDMQIFGRNVIPREQKRISSKACTTYKQPWYRVTFSSVWTVKLHTKWLPHNREGRPCLYAELNTWNRITESLMLKNTCKSIYC